MTAADFIQFGALGIVAFTVWFLLNKLNGTLDKLTTAITQNTEQMIHILGRDEQIHTMLEKRTERFEALEEGLRDVKDANTEALEKVEHAIHDSSEKTLKRLWTLIKKENTGHERKSG